MGDDDTTDDDNYSGFSAPSLSAKNITKNSQKSRVGSQLHGRFDQMNGNFRDLQINVTNSNFDMKEEHHSLYLSDTVTGYKPNNSGGGRDEDDDSSVGDFVIEKKNTSPARLGKQGKSDKGSSILSIPSALSSPANSNRRSMKKSVTFSADTILPREDHLALSITKHLYTRELGFTQYHIQLLYRGMEWTVLKRYRDFSTFHAKLLAENASYQIGLPDLPKKRWFEKQRWLNKFDESYSLHRKNALQDYLRLLAKTPIVKNRFQSFREFLEIPIEKIKEQCEDFDAESEQIDFDLALNQHSKYPQEGNHFIHDVSSANSPSVGHHNRPAQSNHMPDFDDILLPDNEARGSGGGPDKGRGRGESTESTSDYYDEEPDDQGFCYNEPPPSQPYSSTMIYGHNGTNGPPQAPPISSSGHHSPHPLKHVRQHHSPPPSRPTHQTAHSYHHNHHNKNYHHNSHSHHNHPSRPEFRDSILETPLNQQFDDEGDVIISRP
eukprot:CAMPEP_0173145100 /NCGR_PEP_ID=MMETSP1105-20130129/7610_1 /TAXON_ID=2985 /ORGANISM="Ochromonas sp., Strain BG-1" /LENGTH=492 /DNA_ID=CAMNT_0014058873 /DNA_START=16 /DNA_END=1497 /DNA_ORIENTATION=-